MVVLMCLIIPLYTAPNQGDSLKLNFHLFSCRTRKSSKDSLFLNFLIQCVVALIAHQLSEMMTAGLVVLAMNAFNFFMNSSTVWDFVTSR